MKNLVLNIDGLDEKFSTKIDGLDKRLGNQEFLNRTVVVGLLLAILGGLAKLFGFAGNLPKKKRAYSVSRFPQNTAPLFVKMPLLLTFLIFWHVGVNLSTPGSNTSFDVSTFNASLFENT